MSREERANWDERFRQGDHAGAVPDPFLSHLEEYRSLLPEGSRALDVACGAGRNAVWLAENGFAVTGCDISLEGLNRARALADERGVALDLFCVDLQSVPPCSARYDLIACFFFLERRLFPWIKAALRPGGLILYKTYTIDQKRFSGGPRDERYFLQPQELLHEFMDFRVMFYQETMESRGVAQMIAQKPLV